MLEVQVEKVCNSNLVRVRMREYEGGAPNTRRFLQFLQKKKKLNHFDLNFCQDFTLTEYIFGGMDFLVPLSLPLRGALTLPIFAKYIG